MRRRLLTLFALSSLLLALCAVACSNGSEGDPCNTNDDNNGDDDCGSGLQCDAVTTLSGGGSYGDGVSGYGICCPSNLAQATVAPCVNNGGVGLGAPPDGGTDAAATDSGANAANDAEIDGSPDAPAETSLPTDAPSDSPPESSSD